MCSPSASSARARSAWRPGNGCRGGSSAASGRMLGNLGKSSNRLLLLPGTSCIFVTASVAGRGASGPTNRACNTTAMLYKGGYAMKKMLTLGLVATVAVALVLVGTVKAADVTLKGKIVCGKCALKETTDCSSVLIVKDGDKEVKYYIDDKGKGESYHSKFCQAGDKGAEATVTGEVTEKDGKKHLKPSKPIEFK